MGPWAIGDHGAPVSLPKLKKAYEKGTRGISMGPLLTPALGQCPSFQMVSPPLLLEECKEKEYQEARSISLPAGNITACRYPGICNP
ncbi:unnamed protein product [Staurois parvus]|uniref:Uncharacterized protein n=1 Tax=Staurois parvus TaxID=386267 RepID=A0ABN9GEG2_9NEOB|nr:unnamed protein product [Staurois parvus]